MASPLPPAPFSLLRGSALGWIRSLVFGPFYLTACDIRNKMRFLIVFKRVLHESTGSLGQVPGTSRGGARPSKATAQAAWILLRTPLKPRKSTTFGNNSQTVQRFSSVPMLSRIDAQAAAIRAALLQNAKQSNDFLIS